MELPAASDLERELEQELGALRQNPAAFAGLLRARERLYKGAQVEVLKDDLKTKVLLATQSGRQAVNAAAAACDKARNLRPWEFRPGLHRLAADTAEDIAKVGARGLPGLEGLAAAGWASLSFSSSFLSFLAF